MTKWHKIMLIFILSIIIEINFIMLENVSYFFNVVVIDIFIIGLLVVIMLNVEEWDE